LRNDTSISRKVFLVFVFAGFAAAATQSGSVRSGNQSIPGATVIVDCGAERISTVTDDAGRFEIGGLPATPCRFSVSMFGFEPVQRETTASATPLVLDLELQKRATLPVEPAPLVAPAQTNPTQPAPVSAANAAPASPSAATTPSANTDQANTAQNRQAGRGSGRGGYGRGGAPGPGRGGQQTAAAAGRGGASNSGGFQNLSLVQNGDNPVPDADVEPVAGGSDDAGGSSQAFLLNGSVSQGVQAQASDGFGLGGPGAFAPGGPGGQGGNPFGGAGFSADGLPSLAGGAGAPGPGGPGGGFGGPGGGGGRGGGGGGRGGGVGRGGRGGPPNRNVQFGNRINRGRGQQFQGSVFYTVGNSVLNARPYSFTSPTELSGLAVPKAGYASNRFGFSGGGPLHIPKIFSSDKTFWFVNYTGNRSKTGFDDVSTVPTLAERQGDFSGISTVITNPSTGVPFTGNMIPSTMLDKTALGLLNYIPTPNAPGTRNNYQFIGANPSNNDNLQTRINQTITAKDGLDVNFNYQHRNAATIQPFGFVDPTLGYGLSSTLTYRRTINRNFINSLAWAFSRNVTQAMSAFSNGVNIEGELGIAGVTTAPEVYGPPTLTFANFTSLSDSTPSLSRTQTSALTDSLIQIHGKHTITYGLNFQRRQYNTQTDANGRGTFSFNGIESGYDFADFLLSLPQETSVVDYTDNSRYLRESVLSAYATDDFRMASNFTINAGLRWEYFTPLTEKNGDLVNLDIAQGFTGVAPVLPGQTGPYSGSFPKALINSDPKLFSPRIGVAWKPWRAKQVVVRGGYGIYYNGGVYNQLAAKMVTQPPFALTENQLTSLATPLSIEQGLTQVAAAETITNTFAVDKNYKPGYAQIWTASIQQTLGRSYVVQLSYNGTKGTDLDVLQLPNRALPGNPLTAQQRLLIPYASEFTFDSSVGNSTYNALQAQFTRRFARSSSFSALYTFSKAIDDSSTLGGGPVFIPTDIAAERALSPTDQRHTLRFNYQVQSPVKNTQSGKVATLLRGWTVGGTLTANSGTPHTAFVTGDPSGTAYTGNDRAEATGVSVTSGSGYFNSLAFTVPVSGTYGDAGRDTIPGIANWTLNASFFRSFRVDEKRRIEFRIDSTNTLNHPNITSINTTVGSIQYGLPVAAGNMRSVTATVRLRF
jgi:hypothetical protein